MSLPMHSVRPQVAIIVSHTVSKFEYYVRASVISHNKSFDRIEITGFFVFVVVVVVVVVCLFLFFFPKAKLLAFHPGLFFLAKLNGFTVSSVKLPKCLYLNEACKPRDYEGLTLLV